MELLAILCILAFSIAGSNTLPTNLSLENDLKSDLKYASRLSQLIATNLLKDTMEHDGNSVYSPVGVATTLAILAEASNGETYNEFITALGNPKSKADLRQSFKNILSNFQTQSPKSPSFQIWLYIYRNYTAYEEFKQILSDNYYVHVRDINRDIDYYYPEEDNTSLETPSATNSKDVIAFETLKNDNIEASKQASKFDKFVDEQEQPANEAEELLTTVSDYEDDMIYEMLKVDESAKTNRPSPSKREVELEAQENETVQDEEKIEAIRKNYAEVEEIQPASPPQEQESNEPQKVTFPIKQLEDGGREIMQALESHFASERLSGAGSLFRKEYISSALSANSITGREVSYRRKMTLFNAMYYRGNWTYPFQELLSGPNEMFHLTANKSVQAPMMHGRGKFLIADLETQNAWAVSLPYKNQRYSLLVVMPKDIEGLHKLLDQLNPEIFATVKSLSTEREIYISLPKFQVEETSRTKSMLKGLGLRKVFTRGAAEMSQLADDTDLHVDEIAQFVSIKVDVAGSSVYELPTSSVEQKLEVNRPFLYFVLDNIEDFIIVSGKVTAPKFVADLGVV